MVNIIIDGEKLFVSADKTIMDVAREHHIHIPSLCYLKDINEIAACRVCIVEVEGKERLITACNNKVEEGMVIYTNSPKVRSARKTNVELLLSQHNCECATCVRSGNCMLQTLANDLNIIKLPYEKQVSKVPWYQGFPLLKDSDKCIKCMRCVQICEKIQNLNIWDVSNTGSRTTVDVSNNRRIEDSDCSLCGQCITHCPVGALRERDDTDFVFRSIDDAKKITIVQVAPAVRAAWGEALGLPREQATMKRLVGVLRKIGFDYVVDTDFAADLTIMEEGTELLKRIQNHEHLPLFTSCCPGWVRFLKSQYPEMTKHLSSAKSPHQMFGAISKTYYAKMLEVDPNQIVNVSIMPCVAKKQEADLPTMRDANAGQDVDVVLTTREIVRMLRSCHIDAEFTEESEFDYPFGTASGAGVIFGSTGGVMEAALRTAYYLLKGENADPDAFKNVRGMHGWKEAEFTINEKTIKVAIVSGLGNARKLMDAILRHELIYDFVEIMACPGGCSGGGGQPIHEGQEMAEDRSNHLYFLDRQDNLRFSHENPSILKLYEDFLEKPMSPLAEKLLHTNHEGWEMPLEDAYNNKH